MGANRNVMPSASSASGRRSAPGRCPRPATRARPRCWCGSRPRGCRAWRPPPAAGDDDGDGGRDIEGARVVTARTAGVQSGDRLRERGTRARMARRTPATPTSRPFMRRQWPVLRSARWPRRRAPAPGPGELARKVLAATPRAMAVDHVATPPVLAGVRKFSIRRMPCRRTIPGGTARPSPRLAVLIPSAALGVQQRLQHVGSPSFDDERKVASPEGLSSPAKRPRPLCRMGPVLPCMRRGPARRGCRTPLILVAEAHAQDGHPAGERADRILRDAGIFGSPGPGEISSPYGAIAQLGDRARRCGERSPGPERPEVLTRL